MLVAERVAAHLPYLRRFARTVTGSQRSGDAYVVSTLEAILAAPSMFPSDLPPDESVQIEWVEFDFQPSPSFSPPRLKLYY